jgi:hypothetical protein
LKPHAEVAERLKASSVMRALGLGEDGEDIGYWRRGANRHDLIVVTKDLWRLPRPDAACGYKGVFLHFEYEHPGFLLLHSELYPRQESEAKHPRERIQPMLELKCDIAKLVREAAAEHDWAGSIGWRVSGKDLSEPRNLQVGKFALGSSSEDPAFIVGAIEKIARVVVPAIDPIMSERRAVAQ